MNKFLKNSSSVLNSIFFIKKNVSRKVLFCHIPKCGGTTVDNLLSKRLKNNYEKYTHGILRYDLAKYEDFYKFTLIRNPIERLVSTYFYQKNTIDELKKDKKIDRWQGGNWNTLNELYEKYEISCINSFLNKYRDFYFNEIEPFRKIIQVKKPLRDLEVAYEIGFIPQNEFINDENGNLLVNQVVNLKNISDFMKKEFGIKKTTKHNTHKNSTDNYYKYITDKDISMIKEIYNFDYKYLGDFMN